PAGTPSSAAAREVDSSTVRRPWRPVHAFALPACTRTADTAPARSRSRVTTTGAAGAWFVVSTPAAIPGASSAISATSGPRAFSPARTPAKRNPGTRTRCARRASFTRGVPGAGRCRRTAPGSREPVALLVLLAASARARIVAPDLLGVAPHGLDLLRARRGLPVREAHARRRSLLLASLQIGDGGGHRRIEILGRREAGRRSGVGLHRGRLRLQLDAHQLLDHVRLHAADQLLEQVVAFLLVLLQRVLLAVAAQPDALLQVVHAEEVVAPQVVERLQPDDALEVAHHRRGEGGLAFGVRLSHALDHQLLHLSGARHPGGDLGQVEPQVELREHRVVEGLQVPLVGRHLVAAMDADEALGESLRHLARRLAEVLLGEQLAAAGVDHLALLVEDVVVLEQVLADVEVVRLDLLLRVADGAADETVLDWNAILHAEPPHCVLHPVGAEDPQEIVLQRQVETRRARVALPSRAAAQLV